MMPSRWIAVVLTFFILMAAILDEQRNVKIVPNPPLRREVVNFAVGEAPWETTMLGDASIYGHGSEVRLMYTNNTMWNEGDRPNSRDHVLGMAVSTDGINFERPELGIVEWGGSTRNNIVLRAPVQGRFFVDPNPAASLEDRFKYTALFMSRGIYLFTSPDGIHWRRNETMMQPFDCGGGVESFWDDQRGEYFVHMRHEGFQFGRGPGRAAARSRTSEIFRTWPFEPVPNPPKSNIWPLPPITEELPMPFVPNESGQVYRTRALKYRWAPDVYLAFVWRLIGEHPHTYRATELAVSRDGRNWTFFGQPFYMQTGWEIGGQPVIEALSMMGLLREGDELWNYGHVKNVGHDQAADKTWVLRYAQRLDGYVSLDAADASAVTLPFVFEGGMLELNVAAKGNLRVGILNQDRSPIDRFGVDDCVPIRTDAVRQQVAWKSGTDVSSLAGTPVRLRFEMEDAKLFAFQFVP